MKDDRLNVPFRLPPEDHLAFKLAATKRKRTMQGILQELVSGFLANPADPKQHAPYPAATRVWHEKLDFILKSGDAKSISAVHQNLEIFARFARDYVETQEKQGKKHP